MKSTHRIAFASIILAFASTSILAASEKATPVHVNKVTLQVRESTYNPELTEKTLNEYLPKDDPTVKLVELRGSGLFDIVVTAATAEAAATRANLLADAIKSSMGNRVIIWERAEAPEKASKSK